jgi:hypothetical protein
MKGWSGSAAFDSGSVGAEVELDQVEQFMADESVTDR